MSILNVAEVLNPPLDKRVFFFAFFVFFCKISEKFIMNTKRTKRFKTFYFKLLVQIEDEKLWVFVKKCWPTEIGY